MQHTFLRFLLTIVIVIFTSSFLIDSTYKKCILENEKGVKTYTNIKIALNNIDSVYSFSYSGQKLKVIPKEIYKLKNLRQLFLSNNNLVDLDKEIGNLRYLEKLVLFNNYLRDLPIELQKLKRLQTLDLYGNNFEFIPDAICGLDSLKYLYMLGSRIKKYPDCIFYLKNLRFLNIANWDAKYDMDSIQLNRLRNGLPQVIIE